MDPVVASSAAAIAGAVVAGVVRLGRTRRAAAPAFDLNLADALVRQAVDLDRLIAALGELADGDDESLVLGRACRDARRLLEADAVVILEPMADGLLHPTDADGVAMAHLAHVAAADVEVASRLVEQAAGAAAMARAPLVAQGELLGVLVATRDADDPFPPAATSLLAVVADFAARATQNVRLNRHLERLRDEAEARERDRARLSDELVRAEHAERRRLAQGLHDGPQQVVAGVGLMLDSVVEHLAQGGGTDDVARLLRVARDRAKECVRDLRELSFALEPPALREQGLTAAVLPLADRIAEAHGIRFRVDLDAAERIEPEGQAVVFQIVREAIANAVKHARACQIAIRARADGEAVEVSIADDGVGIDDLASSDGLGQGTSVMRERAAALGAEISWRSAGGKGTEVLLRVPASLSARAA